MDRRRSRSRSRSRSLSPESPDRARHPNDGLGNPRHKPRSFRDLEGDRERDRERLERERRERMARMRAENEAEERNLSTPLEGGEGKGAKISIKESSSAASESRIRSLENGSTDKDGTYVEVEEDNEEDEEQNMMYHLLGFSGGFGSTKGKAVTDNQNSAARGAASKNKGRKYRQYMNRKGGFNRPLDKMP